MYNIMALSFPKGFMLLAHGYKMKNHNQQYYADRNKDIDYFKLNEIIKIITFNIKTDRSHKVFPRLNHQ